MGWALIYIFPGKEQRFSMLTAILVSAAIGGALASLDCFIRADAVITRRDNRALNLLVGLGIPILLLLLLLLQSRKN